LSASLTRFRLGVRAPLLLIALCALAVWGVIGYWDSSTSADPLRQIRSRNVEQRRWAALNLRVLTKKTDLAATTAALSHGLQDQDESVRVLVAQSLGQLVHQLKSQPATTTEEKRILGRHEVDAVRLLVGALSREPSALVRASVVESLGATGPQRSVTPPAALAAALEDGSIVWNRSVAKEFYGLI
jgi:HEAT repeat protein